jgi:hypothetical protein
VWNGTLISGLSGSTGTDLGNLGFPVQAGLTWPVHDLSQTVIQYPPGHEAGARLVQQVMRGATLQQVKGLSKIRVLLGSSGYTVTSPAGSPAPSASSSPAVPSQTAAQDACRSR